jgi:Ca-activated chloride channel homolog
MLSIQAATLAADAPPQRKPSILVVTDGNFFIEKALQALALKQSKIIKPSEFDPAQAKQFDLVIYDRHAPSAFPEVGSYLFINCIPPPTTPTFIAVDAKPKTVGDIGIKTVAADHPLLRNINMNKLAIKTASRLNVPPNWTVIASSDDTPLIATRRSDVLLQTVIAFDLQESNWPLKPGFPVFLHNAASWLAEPMADAR